MKDESALSGCSGERALILVKEQQKVGGCREHLGDWCASMCLEDRSQMRKGPLFHISEFELDNS